MAASTDTPLMQQWREAKRHHSDALVFFRVGDFYELFHDDAREASRLLGLTLTSRNNGAAAEVPMAGVPARALDEYLARVVRSGRRAAICDQVEDAAEAKGIVRREVVETVTPGTVMHDTLLTARRNNFLVAVSPVDATAGGDSGADSTADSAAGGRMGLAALDLSTGEFLLEPVSGAALESELGRMEPAELLLPESLRNRFEGVPVPATIRDDWLFDAESGREELERTYRVRTLDGLGFQSGDTSLIQAAGALVQYVRELQPSNHSHLQPPRILRPGSEMLLDEMTRRNLELVTPLRPDEEGGTLVSVLDESVTAMGARLLRRWILRPLVEAEPIWRRQEAVAELVDTPALRRTLRELLADVHDLERLATKVSSGRITPRELLALGRSLALLPQVQAAAEGAGGGEGVSSDLLRELALEMDPLHDVAAVVERAISPEAPTNLQDGGVIRPGHSSDLDDLRETRDGARDFIARLQTRERERTGIGSLKVGFNKVFGYYLEVTKANLDRVPDDYVRKQTLANAERYFTPELKEWEEKVTGAEERILELEGRLFRAVRDQVAGEVARLQEAGARMACLDVLSALAHGAERRGYVRPEIHTGFDMALVAGRHPVVETMMPREEFIPNDLVLDEDGFMVILTGPNMAGKSTILRQVGLIQLMAQMGGFVPADRARLPLCDRIFTRVGASDNLARGQSTFMVEMHETAAIVHGATRHSLVLLDEIGRGTSTYDGVSIAWAVTEHLHEAVGARTIFATHYHELTQLGDLLAGIKNMNVVVRESGDDIVFLRRLEDGGADRSYGIQVARLAGLPAPVVARATDLLRELEGARAGAGDGQGLGRSGALAPDSLVAREQLSIFQPDATDTADGTRAGREQVTGPLAEDPLVARLRELTLDTTTPLEALNLLAELREEARGRSSARVPSRSPRSDPQSPDSSQIPHEPESPS